MWLCTLDCYQSSRNSIANIVKTGALFTLTLLPCNSPRNMYELNKDLGDYFLMAYCMVTIPFKVGS